MRLKTLSERGQALVVIALSAVVLIGFAALAIDGSAKFSDRRHAQNAADTAALAGAQALARQETGACGTLEQWECNALLLAEENGYDDFKNNEVWVFKCDALTADRDGAPLDCGPYEGKDNYLTVIILSHLDTTFARVIGFAQTHNLVQAVTFVQEDGPAFPGFTFVEYKPVGSGCPAEFIVSGSGTVTVDGGGVYVNSNNTGGEGSDNCKAFTQNGCQTTLNVINGGSISTVGGIALQDSCPGNIVSPGGMTEGVAPLPFPPDIVLEAPPECSFTGHPAPINDTVNNISYIYPGLYDTLPPSEATQKTVIMLPDSSGNANYCIYDIVKITNATDLLQGDNVFIYVKYSSKTSPLSIQGGTVDIDAPNDGDYQGWLIYVEPPPIVGGTYSGASKTCKINGGADDYLTGTIYAPYCDFEISGAGNPNGLAAQLIAYTIDLNGNNALYFKYVAGDLAVNLPQVGLMR